MRILKDTHIPFLKYRWIAIAISTVLIAIGLAAMLFGPGLNLGIDFVGGTQVTLKFQEAPDLDRLRPAMEELGLGSPVIQRFDEEEKNEVLIGVQNLADEEGDDTQLILERLDEEMNPDRGDAFDLNRGGALELTSILADADPDGIGGAPEALERHYEPMAEAVLDWRKQHGIFSSFDDLAEVEELTPAARRAISERAAIGTFSLLGAESVGPAVGRDLREKATLAVVGSLLGMLVYIWIRFQLPYGIGALAAVFHDVLITLGALALTQREVSLPTIAAILTLVGYSVNDTVVVFDRVRENLKLTRARDLASLMDRSINQTLSRTVVTSGTTLLVVLALYLFGGDVINTFAFVLLIGIVAGTYSTVFIASPVALAVSRWIERRKAA